MNNSNQEPLVVILMCTFNGEQFIREQLDSIAAQTHTNWKLVISDDGSTDKTLEIARQWAKEVGVERVEFREGPRQGFAQNFLSMACDPSLKADFYAFSDQDDVWLEQKLRFALKLMREEGGLGECDKPILYCGRTTYVTTDLKPYAQSPLFQRPAGFKNALVQSLAGGNTMLFNVAVKNLLEKGRPLYPVASHDWWTYLLVTGCDGVVFYDKMPRVLYRQHNANAVGRNSGWVTRFVRINMLLTGRFRDWTDSNVAALGAAKHLFSDINQDTLESFAAYRQSNIIRRYAVLWELKIFRQTRLGTLALIIGLLLKKI
jgi:glycosyltransferase involved in cell wall biosynthesis